MAAPARKYYDDDQTPRPVDSTPDQTRVAREERRRTPFAANSNLPPAEAEIQAAKAELDQSTDVNPSTSRSFLESQQERLTDPRREETKDERTRREQLQAQQQQALEADERAYQRFLKRKQRGIQRAAAARARTMVGGTQTITRRLVLAVNALSWTPVYTVWMAVQLPFAIMFVVFLGIYYISDETLLGQVANVITWAFSYLFVPGGGDLKSLAGGLAFGSYAIVLASAFIVISGVSLAYLSVGARPLSGRNVILKWGAFMMMWIGYCVPLLNFFPWIILWMYAVQWQPK